MTDTCATCGTAIRYSAICAPYGQHPWRDSRGLSGWADGFGHKPYHHHRPAPKG